MEHEVIDLTGLPDSDDDLTALGVDEHPTAFYITQPPPYSTLPPRLPTPE